MADEPTKGKSTRRVLTSSAGPAISLVLLAGLLFCLEAASYLVLTTSFDNGTFREQMRKARGANGNAAVVNSPYHPFLGWIHAANVEIDTSKETVPGRITSIVTDDVGSSITPLNHESPQLNIAVLGGSTMFGVGSSDNEHTVPSQLEQLISEQLHIRAEVHNYAVRAHQSFQEMLQLSRRIQEQPLDLVLAVSGRNDAYYAISQPQVEYGFLPESVWSSAVGTVHALEDNIVKSRPTIDLSGLRAYSYTYDLVMRLRETRKPGTLDARADQQAFQGMEHLIGKTASITERARITNTHYASLDQICRMNSARFILLLQPTLYTKPRWSEEEKERIEIKFGGETAESEAYGVKEQQFYAAFRELPRNYDMRDLTGVFQGREETLYIDQAHYNDEGANLLAQAVLTTIKPDLEEIIRAER